MPPDTRGAIPATAATAAAELHDQSPARGRIVHVGNVVIDVAFRVGQVPPVGGDVLATSTLSRTGGGFNVMAAAARQGAEVIYAGALGSGPFGLLAARDLAAEGVATPLPARPPEEPDTGVVLVLVDDDGERTFVTSADATLGPTTRQWRSVPIGGRDVVSLSGYTLLPSHQRAEVLNRLADEASDVFLDPGPLFATLPQVTIDATLATATWVSLNLTEAKELTGESEPARAAEALSRRIRGWTGRLGGGVIVRLGRRGALLYTHGWAAPPQGWRRVRLPSPPVPVEDATGAGDTHSGVFLAGLLRGLDPMAACRAANVAAAISITRPGPATAPAGRVPLDYPVADGGGERSLP